MSQKMVRMDMDWNLKQGVPTSSRFKAAVSRQSSSFCLILPIKKNQRSETNKYLRWPVRDITIFFFLLKLSRDNFNLSRDKFKLSRDN